LKTSGNKKKNLERIKDGEETKKDIRKYHGVKGVAATGKFM